MQFIALPPKQSKHDDRNESRQSLVRVALVNILQPIEDRWRQPAIAQCRVAVEVKQLRPRAEQHKEKELVRDRIAELLKFSENSSRIALRKCIRLLFRSHWHDEQSEQKSNGPFKQSSRALFFVRRLIIPQFPQNRLP